MGTRLEEHHAEDLTRGYKSSHSLRDHQMCLFIAHCFYPYPKERRPILQNPPIIRGNAFILPTRALTSQTDDLAAFGFLDLLALRFS